MPPLSFTETMQCQDGSCALERLQPLSNEPLDAEERGLSRPKKAVHFHNDVEVREVPSLKTLPPDEIEATWYTVEDFQVIKRAMTTTIRLMIAQIPMDGDMCPRGLECRTPTGAKERKASKLNALRVVWNEQVSQWKAGTTDDEKIRMVYEQQTVRSRDVALQLGKIDEQVAQRYRNDGDDYLNDSGSGYFTVEPDEQPRIRQHCQYALSPTEA
jgi:hypothetical protein